MHPETMTGRLPGQGDGPDACSVRVTTTSITALRPDVRQAVTYSLADLPADIAARITVRPVSSCWIVGGSTDRDGYSRIRGRGGHRVIWELLVGEIPPGLVLDHREDWGCLSKACGFPGHLLPVTPFVNATRDGAGGVGALNIRKTRCGACGAEYDLLNTYFKPSGGRDCRRCIARRAREYKARQRAALVTISGQLELGRAA